MYLLKQYKWQIIALIAIALAYFTTRLYRLDSLPIFTDEAIYMWWAQTGKIDASWRFISLVDGKGPFYIWLSMAAMYGIKDPLLAGRLISVFAGFITAIGLFLLGRELFKSTWVGIVTAGLYVLYPIALVHDRMALYDTLVGTIFVWALYVEVLLVKKIHSTLAFILALVLGAGMLTKSSAFIAAALLPTTLLLFDQKKGERKRKFFAWVAYSLLAVGLAYIYYSFLRVSPFFSVIAKKNTEFVYPLGEWIQHPFAYALNNMLGIATTLNGYVTVPALLLVVISFFVYKRFFKEKLLLFLWFVAPLVYLTFFGKVIYPRHYLFATLFILPLIAISLVYFFQRVKSKILVIFLIILLFAMQLYTDYAILTNFTNAPIPNVDKFQYINGWPAGGGVKEAIAFFQNESRDKKIEVYTQGTFGLMPYALNIFLQDNKNVHITGLWPINSDIPTEVVESAKISPTYILFYQECKHVGCTYIGDAPPQWPLEQVLKVQKFNNIYLSIYKVKEEILSAQ